MSDGKLKADTDELWSFFSDLNFAMQCVDEECDEYEKRLAAVAERLEKKIRQVDTKVEQLQGEVTGLKAQTAKKSDDVANRIAALQNQIESLEEQKLKMKKYRDAVPEYLGLLENGRKKYRNTISEGKKIVNRYLKMVEVTAAQKEFADYQKSGGNGQYHTMNYRGTTFYCKDDEFDPGLVDSSGRTNLERMEHGVAPIGRDGKAVELHHMIQSEKRGSIVEVSGSVHRKHHKALHINTHDIPSGINRMNFDVLRSAYWKRRAEFMKQGSGDGK